MSCAISRLGKNQAPTGPPAGCVASDIALTPVNGIGCLWDTRPEKAPYYPRNGRWALSTSTFPVIVGSVTGSRRQYDAVVMCRQADPGTRVSANHRSDEPVSRRGATCARCTAGANRVHTEIAAPIATDHGSGDDLASVIRMNSRIDTDSVFEDAEGKWAAILLELGVNPKLLNGRNQPCPWCGGADRFRFNPRSGPGFWICTQCGSGNGFSLLRKLRQWDARAATVEVAKVLGTKTLSDIRSTDKDRATWRKRCRWMWENSRPIREGDPVWSYLRSRGLEPPFPVRLRMMERCRWHDGERAEHYPAMLAKVDDANGNGVTLHRTWITPEGKLRKAMPGEIPEGSAIRLDEYSDTLGVAEGIETAMSAQQMFRMPVWSVMGTALMRTWWPPINVTKVVVFGDNDLKAAGQAAGWHLIHRLRLKGITAFGRWPDREGDDWNDVLMRQHNERSQQKLQRIHRDGVAGPSDESDHDGARVNRSVERLGTQAAPDATGTNGVR